MQRETRYTELPNGRWIIEAVSPVTIAAIEHTMQFIDHANKPHHVVSITKPAGNPEAPYFYFIEVEVEDMDVQLPGQGQRNE